MDTDAFNRLMEDERPQRSEGPRVATGYNSKEGDGADRLCKALYGRKPKAKDYLGGSDAVMLYDAASKIHRLTQQLQFNEASVATAALEALEGLENGNYHEVRSILKTLCEEL